MGIALAPKGARVISRPTGSGWFKAHEVLSEDGQLLAQLNAEEKRAEWAKLEAVFSVEVVNIIPPGGRSRTRRG